MAATLERLLRVRSLLEDVARIALEREVIAAARIDRTLRREEDAARRLHSESLAALLDGSGRPERDKEREERFLAGEELEAGGPARVLLEMIAAQAARRTMAGRDEFLTRQKERRQIEILLEAQARRRRLNEMRREQRSLDEWFAVKARQRRVGGK